MKNILITGGAGFIGSHTCIELASAGYRPIILDNLCNSYESVIDRISILSSTRPVFYRGDVRSANTLDEIFSKYSIEAVIHFAGLKSVGDSLKNSLEYYDNNICGTLALLSAMSRAGVLKIVFSSSATVYGDPDSVPIYEEAPLSATNPYGRTKLMAEQILADVYRSDSRWRIARLRYFNPVGAHESGLIGEAPMNTPNNLMPFIADVASGHRDYLPIWGGDYATPDGTGVRDYIHVCDLAEGHIAALEYLYQKPSIVTLNLGAGVGYSVLEIVKVFERVSGKKIPYKIEPRRFGDVASCWADASLAEQLIGWKATRSLEKMCSDVWRWQQKSETLDSLCDAKK